MSVTVSTPLIIKIVLLIIIFKVANRKKTFPIRTFLFVMESFDSDTYEKNYVGRKHLVN